jgi:hypothetical protein
MCVCVCVIDLYTTQTGKDDAARRRLHCLHGALQCALHERSVEKRWRRICRPDLSTSPSVDGRRLTVGHIICGRMSTLHGAEQQRYASIVRPRRRCQTDVPSDQRNCRNRSDDSNSVSAQIVTVVLDGLVVYSTRRQISPQRQILQTARDCYCGHVTCVT